MDMMPADVLVLEDKIGLVTVTEPLHVFPADFRQLAVGQHVVGMRIEEMCMTGFSRCGNGSASIRETAAWIHPDGSARLRDSGGDVPKGLLPRLHRPCSDCRPVRRTSSYPR
ncbi:hypothetical protein NXW78_28170 [Bacteroides ovatus]|nr:hypothetical protein [Bacteroides ovatus]